VIFAAALFQSPIVIIHVVHVLLHYAKHVYIPTTTNHLIYHRLELAKRIVLFLAVCA
jgi:hypothetical protein